MSLIAQIEPLKWDKASTELDFAKWFKVFECSLVINNIDTTKAADALRAKTMLYAYGGDKIRSTCEQNATYKELTYMLKLHNI